MGNQPSQPEGDLPPMKGKNKVQVASSVLGGVPGFTGYHTSVLVDGEEFFFSDMGIHSTTNLGSHAQAPGKPTVVDIGTTDKSGRQMVAALQSHFLPGTYDLLRKNCNSFSDCALYYLCHRRLDPKFRSLEKLGANFPDLLAQMSGGSYSQNPKADGFDVEKLVASLDPDRVWKTQGHAVGGTGAAEAELTPEEMRRQRLARLGGDSAGTVVAAAAEDAPAPAPTATPTAPSAEVTPALTYFCHECDKMVAVTATVECRACGSAFVEER